MTNAQGSAVSPRRFWVSVFDFRILACNFSERGGGGNNLQNFEGFHLKNSSSKGQDMALTVLYVPSSLESGSPRGE